MGVAGMLNLIVALATPSPPASPPSSASPGASAASMVLHPSPDSDLESSSSGRLRTFNGAIRLGGLEMRKIAFPEMKHHADRGVLTIEVTESTIVALYLSGCAVFIGGLWMGCLIWQQQAKRPVEKCECAWCNGQYQKTRKIAEGGFGEASLVSRSGKTYVLKRIGCANVNAANQALMEASCLQRLRHPNVVRFEDLFMHRHDHGGCSVLIVMEYCSGGDLIDRLECSRGQRALSEVQVRHSFAGRVIRCTCCKSSAPGDRSQVVEYLQTLCQALHHVHCCGVLHRDLKVEIHYRLHATAVGEILTAQHTEIRNRGQDPLHVQVGVGFRAHLLWEFKKGHAPPVG
ncbi:MAG: hypothetical protein SGPRY_001956 [Prymnesium sp.]